MTKICHPCCRLMSLRTASRVISIIDAIGGMFGAVSSGLLVLALLYYRDVLVEELENDENLSKNYELKAFLEQPEWVQYSILGFTIFISTVEIIVAIILFQGARMRNLVRCKIWFKIHCCLLLISMVFIARVIYQSEEKIIVSVVSGLGLIYQIWTLWIVRAFAYELENFSGKRKAMVDTGTNCSDDEGEPLQEIKK